MIPRPADHDDTRGGRTKTAAGIHNIQLNKKAKAKKDQGLYFLGTEPVTLNITCTAWVTTVSA